MLIKLLAIGRCKYHLVIIALGLQCRYATVNRLTLHHHASKSAIGIVVYAAPLISRIVAQIVQMYLGQALFLGSCQYRFVDKAL